MVNSERKKKFITPVEQAVHSTGQAKKGRDKNTKDEVILNPNDKAQMTNEIQMSNYKSVISRHRFVVIREV